MNGRLLILMLILGTALAGLDFSAAQAQASADSYTIPGYVDKRLQEVTAEFDVRPASRLKLSMSLRDAAHQALDNHPGLHATWHRGMAQGAEAQGLWGEFDYTLTAGLNMPVATETLAYSKELARVSLAKRFTTGSSLAVEYHLDRDPDGLFVSGNGKSRLYRHRFGVRAVQPLARGRGQDANLAGLRAATADFEAESAYYRRYAQEVVFSVERAYWKHFAAQRSVTVYEDALSAAQGLQALSRSQYEAGELSRLELIVAEAGVASRREGVIIAGIEVDKSRDALLALLVGSSSPSWLSAEVQLLTQPDTTAGVADALPTLDHILAQRHDFAAVEQALTAADLRVVEARNLGADRIDLVLESGYATMGSSLGTQYEDPTSGQPVSGPYIFAGVEVAFALPGSRAGGANRQAAANREAAHWNRETAVRAIVLEIRQGYLDLESSLERIRVTRTARAAMEEQLRGERGRFAMGQTSNQSALLSENELRSAKIREIRALADLQVARARLRLAAGTTLDHFDLGLE